MFKCDVEVLQTRRRRREDDEEAEAGCNAGAAQRLHCGWRRRREVNFLAEAVGAAVAALLP
jgi:hypothetical protein